MIGDQTVLFAKLPLQESRMSGTFDSFRFLRVSVTSVVYPSLMKVRMRPPPNNGCTRAGLAPIDRQEKSGEFRYPAVIPSACCSVRS